VTPLRIVLVMLEAPIPFGHAAARCSYVLLRELVARGHHVSAFAACSKTSEMDHARELFPSPNYDLRLYEFPVRKGPAAKLQTLWRPHSYMFSRELKRDLEAVLAQGFDLMHLEQLWTGWVGLEHRDRVLINVHQLYRIDLRDVQPRGIRNRFVQGQLFRAEQRLIRGYSQFLALSDRLRDEMQLVNPGATVSVVPLGVEPAFYPYIPDERRTSEPVVSLIGTMSWYPTHSAAVRLVTKLWPKIKKRVPAARLQLVGWGARSALAEYLRLSDVTIEENVKDTRPCFERTAVMVYAPGRGSGMKVKVLEALGYGIPVVTTTEGIEGLPAVDGVHAGICEDDDGLIDRTVQLLTDYTQQNRQRLAGRALLESHCGPKPTVDAIEAIYARMILGR
jgi:polysaccharide biosynthesis protein PslH